MFCAYTMIQIINRMDIPLELLGGIFNKKNSYQLNIHSKYYIYEEICKIYKMFSYICL